MRQTKEYVILKPLILMAGLALLASGCARSTKFAPEQVTAATVANDLGAPTSADIVGGRRPYNIGPFDKLAVQVFGVQELDRAAQVDANGYVALPLIGSVLAAGETSESLARKIQDLYGQRYLRDPQVSVSVTEAISQQVAVDGGVSRPGLYPVNGNSTLMTTIASANGTSEFAKLNQVLIFRTIDSKRMVARYSLELIRGGRAPDPAIYGNDVIIVGTGPGRLNIRDLLLLTPVLGAFYQFTR